MKDWICVYSTGNPVMAEIAKGVLGDNNITAVLLNQQDSFYKFGEVEVRVQANDCVKAKHLLKELN